jgi:molecular chaperone DnaK
MVGFTATGERVIGERARVLLAERPEFVAVATKRYIGRRFSETLAEEAGRTVPYSLVPGTSNEVRVRLGDRTLPLPQLSAMVLAELKLDAEAYFGRPVTKAVITVPANFDDAQRQATKEAAEIAGLTVLRIVNEPTAAAVAYGLTQNFRGRALVFDLGGGTFDVSVLEVEAGVFQVKATGGEPYLGGEDFDQRIVEWLLAQVDDSLRESVMKDRLSVQRLKLAAERAKRKLSTHSEAIIAVEDLGDHSDATNQRFAQLETALTRDFFDRLSEPLTRRCLEVCQSVMTQAKISPTDVDAVLLVGGMTRVPLIRKLVWDFFGKEPRANMNPDEVVALGAALHAHELAEQGGAALLLDVASHSLGVGIAAGKVKRVVEKNTAIPVVAREIFLPSHANQTEARIPIFQGESDTQDKNSCLGELVLKDLNAGARADRPLEVTFELSAEGTLNVRAVDLTTGASEVVRIEARTELQKPELERLKKNEATYAREQRVEQQMVASEVFKKLLQEGEEMAKALQDSAREAPGEATQRALTRMDALLDEARAAMEANDASRMTEAAKQLKQLTAAR